MINRQQTAQRALTGDGVVKNTQSYLRCKICASVRHLPKMDKFLVQYLPRNSIHIVHLLGCKRSIMSLYFPE